LPIQLDKYTTPKNLPLRRPALLAFFGVLLIVGVWSLFTLVGGVDFRDIEQSIHDGDPGKLKTPILAQSFVSPHDNLSRVELQLASPITQALPVDMRAMLVRGEGLDNLSLGETVFGISKLIDEPGRSYLSVSFPPIPDSQGMTYTFMLSTPGYSVNSILRPAWSTADALSSGAMYTEDGAQAGDLGITTYYRYTFATLLGDVGASIAGHLPAVLVWLALLLLPGMALLVWLPNSLNTGQRLLAAPALSALILPVIFLLASIIDMPIGRNKLWGLLALCALTVAARIAFVWRTVDGGRWTIDSGWAKLNRPPPTVHRPPSTVFWLAFSAVLILTAITRLASLRDLEAGVGMDAYHHTMITALFLRDSGIPGRYVPFAPLASFTYHFGFHTLATAIAWLTGNTQPTDLLALIPQVGQVAGSVLPIPALTLFGWRVLGNRWIGLAAGALAGLVSVVPAFYAEWSRYTQGLGLAVLPVAWVLFIEAVRFGTKDEGRRTKDPEPELGNQGAKPLHARVRPSSFVLRPSSFALAALAAAGLFLTHYRITVIYAGFALLYLLWRTLTETPQPAKPPFTFYVLRFTFYASRAALVAILALIVLLPWLLNFATNFHTNFTGKDSPDVDVHYYAAAERLGGTVLSHPSLAILASLCALGVIMLGLQLWRHSLSGLALGSVAGLTALGFALYVWMNHNPLELENRLQSGFLGLSYVTWFLLLELAILGALLIGAARTSRGAISREAVVVIPILTWLVLALWSSPQLLPSPFRLPLVGYLDAVTLASSAWLPACLLAGYALVNTWQQVALRMDGRRWTVDGGRWKTKDEGRRTIVANPPSTVHRLPSTVLPTTIAVIVLAGIAAGMSLAPIKERRPYIEPSDVEALTWMRDNLPRDSYVLANSFTFPWSPTQPLGLDSGLWIPLVAGIPSSVPPITAYNEKPVYDEYFSRVQRLAALKPLPGSATNWQALKEEGVTHIFIGSRADGEGFSAPDLLKDTHVQLLFHRDSVWLFLIV
jgi:hypothetical protein